MAGGQAGGLGGAASSSRSGRAWPSGGGCCNTGRAPPGATRGHMLLQDHAMRQQQPCHVPCHAPYLRKVWVMCQQVQAVGHHCLGQHVQRAPTTTSAARSGSRHGARNCCSACADPVAQLTRSGVFILLRRIYSCQRQRGCILGCQLVCCAPSLSMCTSIAWSGQHRVLLWVMLCAWRRHTAAVLCYRSGALLTSIYTASLWTLPANARRTCSRSSCITSASTT